jgi:hypothetical protein
VRTAHVNSRVDTTGSTTFDQQYQIHFAARSALSFRYFASLRFRHLQTESDLAGNTWRTELQPAVNVVWSNSLYKIGGDYVRRENRDRRHANDLIGRSASVNFQTNLRSLPRFNARYEWTQNVNDLELMGLDTRQRRLSAGVDYFYENLTLHYKFSDRVTKNRNSGLEQTSRRHVGRVESAFQPIRGVLSIESSYQGIVRYEKEVRPAVDVSLLPITPVTTLYAVNPTPEFGALDPQPALTDGNVESPASPLMNLSGEDVHNFGVDFGSAVTVDHLFLSTDTLANPDLRWAIYTSEDNLTWDLARDFESYPYSVAFYRYEIAFASLTTRYIKIVVEPDLQNEAVYVTELRALVSREQDAGPNESTDHRAGLTVRFHPLRWLAAGVDGTFLKTGRSQTSLAREQDGLNASLRVLAARWFELSGSYQFSRTGYPQRISSQTDTDILSVTVNSRWLNTLTTGISAYRQREIFGRELSRRQDGVKVRVNADWLPDLKGITDLGYSESHQFFSDDLFFMRSFGQSLDARPTDRSTIVTEYRFYSMESRSSTIPTFRYTISLRGSYRLTASILARGNAAFHRETGQAYQSWNGVLSWAVTPNVSLAAGINRSQPDQGGSTTLHTLQGTWRWTRRTDVSFSYAYNDFEDRTRADTSHMRFSFNTRF